MNVNRWLLPDGVEEVLPAEAQSVEQLRRRLLDLYASWGYELIMPPLLEFTDSLLSGLGSDLDLLTVKVVDQLSGKLMGLRADMTPQAARIDAHSYVNVGPSRLCYADHVLHAKPKSPLAVRTPLHAGVELFGEASLDADIEVISLLLASLAQINVPKVTFALGHVGICRALLESLSLSAAEESVFFVLLQAKDTAEIRRWASENFESAQTINWLTTLPTLCGGVEALANACEQLQDAPAEVEAAIDELRVVAGVMTERYPGINIYFDLSELRGYHYHTGLVFAAFAEGVGDAIANGGRYDHIGEAFGRARPATGFSLNITSVLPLLSLTQPSDGIYAPPSTDAKQWQAIQLLRTKGERVVSGLSQVPAFTELRCDRQLALVGNAYIVQAL